MVEEDDENSTSSSLTSSTDRDLEALKLDNVRKVSKLLGSARLETHMTKVEDLLAKTIAEEEARLLQEEQDRQDEASGMTDGKKEDAKKKKNKAAQISTEEYELIVESNQLMVDLQYDVMAIHKFLKQLYNKRFPELETMVPAPLDYARVVLRMANNKDLSTVELDDLLPSATKMVVCVAATTSEGQLLSEDELQRLTEGCQGILRLNEVLSELLQFVQMKMADLAPNLTTLVGSAIAAQLLAAAGGLEQLANLPASTIQILGKDTRQAQLHQTGLAAAAASAVRHVGYLHDCDLVQMTPLVFRKRLVRVLAGKATIAIRFDAFGEDSVAERSGSGSDSEEDSDDEDEEDEDEDMVGHKDSPQVLPRDHIGAKFFEMIKKKVEKWQEPPPQKYIRALPVPAERPPRKRRGGKRFRKQKERLAMTQLRSQQNRLAFGVSTRGDVIDADQLGLLDQSEASGAFSRIRIQASDRKITRKNARNLAIGGRNTATTQYGGNTGSTATSSSSAITSFPTGPQSGLISGFQTGAPSVPGTATSAATGMTSSLTFTPVQGLQLVDPRLASTRAQESSRRYFSSNPSFKK
eukprot:TRINITY_DN3165_c0_g1_i1.p1 TRINITY_DN3165_c0_g1~~TRINITY_DN3165_c0_g1_i1.p1  ORF type:complete len:641 (-),score=261.22 TRINITY_DN3165_c0_g1_i1:26-1768(-)